MVSHLPGAQTVALDGGRGAPAQDNGWCDNLITISIRRSAALVQRRNVRDHDDDRPADRRRQVIPGGLAGGGVELRRQHDYLRNDQGPYGPVQLSHGCCLPVVRLLGVCWPAARVVGALLLARARWPGWG